MINTLKSGAVSTIKDDVRTSKNSKLLNQEVSYYEQVKATTPVKSINYFNLLEELKKGTPASIKAKEDTLKEFKKYLDNTINVTEEERVKEFKIYKEKIATIKESLHLVSFSGTFSTRANENLLNYTGVIPVDIDKFQNEAQRDDVHKRLKKLPYIAKSFITPSILGLKALIFTDNKDPKKHKSIFNHIKKEIEKVIIKECDPSIKDISRGQYIPYDPNAYFNPNFEVYKTENIKEVVQETKTPITYSTDNIDILCNDIEASKKVICKDYETWRNVGFALASEYKEAGEKYFHQVSKAHKNYNYKDTQTQYKKGLDSNNKGISIGTFYYIAKLSGFNVEYKFWKLKKVKNRVDIVFKDTMFFNFLQSKGFYQVKVYDDVKLIRKNENIISEVTPEDIKQFVLKYIDTYQYNTPHTDNENKIIAFANKSKKSGVVYQSNEGARYQIYESAGIENVTSKEDEIYKSILLENKYYPTTSITERTDLKDYIIKNTKLFKIDYLNALEYTGLNLLEDTKETSFKPFLNGVVKVTKDNIELIPYNEIKGHVWEAHIIKHNFIYDDEFRIIKGGTPFFWTDFISKLSNNKFDRQTHIEKCLGYLLHTYKDSANAKMIAFTDNKLSSEANGGSGKSLLGEALKYMCSSSLLAVDGKKHKGDDTFAFSGVKMHHTIVLLEDVKRNFDFERFYNLVTNDFEVEAKNKNSFIIPFKDSPKIMTTCNFPLNGVAGSHRRRRIEVPIYQFFNADLEPIDIYKKRFFDDFTEIEWNKFFNWSLNNVKVFLKEGLSKITTEHQKENYFCQATDIEFLRFCQNGFIPTNETFRYKEICEAYKEETGFTLTGRKCSVWIDLYCEYAGLKKEETTQRNYKLKYIDEKKQSEDLDKIRNRKIANKNMPW